MKKDFPTEASGAGLEDQLTGAAAPEGPLDGYRELAPVKAPGKIPISLADLELIPDEMIAAIDAAVESRLIYGVSLLALRNFLRKAPPDWDQATRQATLALGYIKHCEARGLKHLQLGRHRKDEELTRQIQVIKDELRQVAEQRATIMAGARRGGGTNGEETPA